MLHILLDLISCLMLFACMGLWQAQIPFGFCKKMKWKIWCAWIINAVYFYFRAISPEAVPTSLRFCSPCLHRSHWLCHSVRLVSEKVQFAASPQRRGGKRIWLMHVPCLYIHGHFLESIRKTWLIQVEVLIEVLSAVDFPFYIQHPSPRLSPHRVGSLSSLFPSPCSLTPPCSPFIRPCFRWWDVRDSIHWAALSRVSFYESEGSDPLWTGDEGWSALSSIMDPEGNGVVMILVQWSSFCEVLVTPSRHCRPTLALLCFVMILCS